MNDVFDVMFSICIFIIFILAILISIVLICCLFQKKEEKEERQTHIFSSVWEEMAYRMKTPTQIVPYDDDDEDSW